MVGKGAFKMCFVSECSKDCVCVDVCVCVNIASPVLDPTSCITRGSVLVSPGDSQSVLALQYKEIIVIFKKLPLQLGSVFCKPACGTARLEYVLVCEKEFVCMLTVTVTHYIFIWKQMCDWKRKDVRQCRALVTCQAVKNIGSVIVLQWQTVQQTPITTTTHQTSPKW